MHSIQTKTICHVARAAQIVGKTEAAVRQDIARERIPFHRNGKRIYFFVEDLLEFLERQPGVSVDQALETVETS